MWVGYIWNGRGCLVLPWLQNHKHGILLAFITAISHVNVSKSKLNIYPVKFLYEITDMSEGERSWWDGGGGHRVKSG